MVGAAGAELGKAEELDAHCCLVPALLLFISGHFAFIFSQPGSQPTTQPRAG